MRTRVPFHRQLVAALILLASSVATWAAAPNAPVEFEAENASNLTTTKVALSWFANRAGDAATSFDVYRAEGETEDLSLFDKIGSVDVTPNNSLRFSYYDMGLEPGVYTYFVKAVNADGESDRTRIRVVRVGTPEPKVFIVGQPNKVHVVGSAYYYMPRLETNLPDGNVEWSLVQGPDGMTINATTGKVSWDVPVEGRHEIKIKVTVSAGGVSISATQAWVLEVKKEGNGGDDRPKACAAIYGTVTIDGSDRPAEGKITAWLLKEGDNSNAAWRPVFSAVLRQGTYVLELPAGTYKLRAEGPGFYAEWHENAAEVADAANVTIECDTRTEVNFTVEGRPQPKVWVVRGRVTDETTGEGLKAVVVFEARERDDNTPENFRRRVAETNAEGYYEIEVAEGVHYIALAKAGGRDNFEKYLPEFWEETGDATLATSINATADVDGINFTLGLRPTYENRLAGQLLNDSTGAAIVGKVTAYALVTKEGKDEQHKVKVVTVETNNDGGFVFENLEPGTYILFGHPGERPFVPGWYVEGEVVAHAWKNATQLTVESTSSIDGIEIRFKAVGEIRGKGRLRGWVFNRGGSIRKDDGKVEANTAVNGALVVALDAQGNVVDWTMSAGEGNFQLTNMMLGTSTVVVDRFGFEGTSQSVTLDAENVDVDVNFGLNATTSVEVPIDLVGTTMNLYPNPASATTKISFVSQPGTITVEILSMTGTVLSTTSTPSLGGETSVDLNVSSIPSGMTMVRVSNGTTTFALPLSVVR